MSEPACIIPVRLSESALARLVLLHGESVELTAPADDHVPGMLSLVRMTCGDVVTDVRPWVRELGLHAFDARDELLAIDVVDASALLTRPVAGGAFLPLEGLAGETVISSIAVVSSLQIFTADGGIISRFLVDCGLDLQFEDGRTLRLRHDRLPCNLTVAID